MRPVFFSEPAQLRDGWKSLCFVLACMACFVLVGVVGRSLPPAIKAFAPSAVLIAGLGLLVSLAAVRLEGTRLAGIGLQFDARFARQFGLGLLAGGALVAVCLGLVCGLAGVTLEPIAAPGGPAVVKLVVTVLAGALFEELLFRGYAFQRAVRGMGRWPAIALFSLFFSLAHLPGNLDIGAATGVAVLAGLVLDCVIQSLILLRTGSLALPIGLHGAWNLVQGALGFGVSGTRASSAWFRPELGSQPGWLTGGDYGLEASVASLAVQVVVLAWLLGSARPTSNVTGRDARSLPRRCKAPAG